MEHKEKKVQAKLMNQNSCLSLPGRRIGEALHALKAQL